MYNRVHIYIFIHIYIYICIYASMILLSSVQISSSVAIAMAPDKRVGKGSSMTMKLPVVLGMRISRLAV
jgi:hypothetical protein